MLERVAKTNQGHQADITSGEDLGLTLQEQGVGVLIETEYIGIVEAPVDIVTVRSNRDDQFDQELKHHSGEP